MKISIAFARRVRREMIITVNGTECTEKEVQKIISAEKKAEKRAAAAEKRAAAAEREIFIASTLQARNNFFKLCHHIQRMKEGKRDNWCVENLSSEYLGDNHYKQIYSNEGGSGAFIHYRYQPVQAIRDIDGEVAIKVREILGCSEYLWKAIGIKDGKITFEEVPFFLYADVERIGKKEAI